MPMIRCLSGRIMHVCREDGAPADFFAESAEPLDFSKRWKFKRL